MFRYFADPLCIVCCLAYVVNRFLLKPHWHSGFFHSYFNDALLIPCALPLVLVLGPGRGLFVERFLQSNRGASVVCVDSSMRMLALTRDRIVRSVENPERVIFVRADVLDDQVDWLDENDSFDLVVSHFFLDC